MSTHNTPKLTHRNVVMRLLGAALLTFVVGAHAEEWNVPLKSPSRTEELQGRIGKLPIHMHLEVTDVWRCTDDHLQSIVGDRYTGWYEYTKVGKHITIHGFYNSQGAGGALEHPPLEIYETVDGKNTGTFMTTQDDMGRGIWEGFGEHPRRLRYVLDIVSFQSHTPPDADDSICPKGPADPSAP